MTRTCFAAASATLAAALFAPLTSAQEVCTTATPIFDGATPFSNVGAIDEGPAFGCGTGPALDVWFAYTALADGALTVETCGSGFDTRLEIYDDCAGIELACNDDSCSLQSSATVAATSGTVYYIRAAGWNGANGMGTLTVTGPTPPVVPDDCTTAAPVTPNMLEPFDTTTATPSAEAWACTGNTAINDVWYTFTASADYAAEATTCGMANYDTRLEVFEGACGGLVSLACNDDACGAQSTVGWAAVNGTQYWVRVGGFTGSSVGQGDLLVTGPPPAVLNDECVAAIEIFQGVPEMFDNSMATNSDPLSGPWTCGGTSSNARDVWYRFSIPVDGSVTVDTFGSMFDTRLAIYEGGCGALSLIGCNDDSGGLQSQVTFAGICNTTYLARVGGFSANVGMGQVTATFSETQPNDECIDAIPVGLGMSTFCSTGATASLVDMSCVFNGEMSDVWFSFTSPSTCPITIDLSGSLYDTGMAVYSGDCGALTELDCDDDGGTGLDSLVSFNATAGTTYLVQIGGFNGASGDGVMNITENGGIGVLVCAGEPNSTGVGAELKLLGSDVLADMDLTIAINDLPLNSMGYVVTSQEQFTVLNPGGSVGNLCIASFTMGRFAGNVLDSGALGSASFSPDLTAFPTPTGSEPVLVGDTRYFQHWYRDSVGGMAVSNFSSACGVTFL